MLSNWISLVTVIFSFFFFLFFFISSILRNGENNESYSLGNRYEFDIWYAMNRTKRFSPSIRLNYVNQDQIDAQTLKAFSQIADEMGYGLKDWTKFAAELAVRYDERLKVYTEKGKFKKWSTLSMCLWYDVQEFKAKTPGSTDHFACNQLSGVGQWKDNNNLYSDYKKHVKTALWLQSAEEIGWEVFGQRWAQLMNLETRKETLETIFLTGQGWPGE